MASPIPMFGIGETAILIGFSLSAICSMSNNFAAASIRSPDSVKCNFRGFINHYNLKRSKIDCAGLDIDALLKDIK